MGNVLHIIFRYFIDTQAGVVRAERVLLLKGDANDVLPTAIAVYRDADIVYRVMCIAINQCIVPALIIIFEFGSFGSV